MTTYVNPTGTFAATAGDDLFIFDQEPTETVFIDAAAGTDRVEVRISSAMPIEFSIQDWSYERAVEVMETDFHAWGMLLTCYRAVNDDEGVRHSAQMMVEQAQKALAEDPSNGAALGLIAGGFARLGERERAREWIDRAMLIDPDNLNTTYNFACILVTELQEVDTALDLLEPTFAKAGNLVIRHADTDPDFDSIRDHPRFQRAIENAKSRLGLS